MIQIPSWTLSFKVLSKFAQLTNKIIIFPATAFPSVPWAIKILVSLSSLAIKVLQMAIELTVAGMMHKSTKKPMTLLKCSVIQCFNRNILMHSNKCIWTDDCLFLYMCIYIYICKSDQEFEIFFFSIFSSSIEKQFYGCEG